MKRKVLEWVVDVAENDSHESFEQLYAYFSSGLQSYVYTIVEDREVALDLVQDLFVTLWANRRTLSAVSNIGHYLYSSIKNNAVRYVNKRSRVTPIDNEHLEQISLDAMSPELTFIAREQFQQLQNSINSLPYKCRLVFRLVKEDGLKYKDVAQLLEISVKTVEAHMTLAYSRIVDCFEQMLPGHQEYFKPGKKAQ
ncbi:RNA polymerase sigma-70 factor [Niabella sp. 22666]|jgi:RNA polymerase sigma-70 factor (ECF subfamily)|uniref:RNA polymerase sigma-70 factor n=1 Tax=Niabella sp. 22666 TaxID=3453954 RepID=UPI003F844688